MLLMILMEKKLLEHFYGKELQKTIQEEFRIEKVIKRKSDKFYVKLKGCNNSFDSWIKKKTLRYFNFKSSFKLRWFRAR